MKIYTLTDEQIEALLRRTFLRLFAGFGVFLIATNLVLVWAMAFNPTSTACSTVLLLGVLSFGLWRGTKQQKEIFSSIRVELGEDYVARSQARIDEIRVERANVARIEETTLGLQLHTLDDTPGVIIPIQLLREDYQEIREQLAQWADIETKITYSRLRNVGLFVTILIGLGIVFLSQTIWMVAIVGLALIAFYGYLWWQTRHVAGIDPNFQRRFTWIVAIMSLVIVFKLIILVINSLS